MRRSRSVRAILAGLPLAPAPRHPQTGKLALVSASEVNTIFRLLSMLGMTYVTNGDREADGFAVAKGCGLARGRASPQRKTCPYISDEVVEIAELNAGDERTPFLLCESRYGSLGIACIAD